MLALFVLLAFVLSNGAPGFCTPLDDYVQAPDDHYSYKEAWEAYKDDTKTVYYLNMTSQKWLTEADCSQSIWWHYMCIVVPHNVRYHDHALLYITGGDNNNDKPDLTDEELFLITSVSVETGMIGAILYQIPNQPIYFPSDSLHKRRTEDAIIAFTWYTFMQDPSKPEWLLRLPMTKAAVRAMDTVTDFVLKKTTISISKFFVAGASKRGWTTWTTAAVDKRVVGITPIVLDAINVPSTYAHIWRSYGNWSFALDDYYDMNLTVHLFDPAFKKVTAIVDPISYADRLTMPKYIISATGDEFQMPDDTLYYGRSLPGQTYYRLMPNSEHSCLGHSISIMLGLGAFFTSIAEKFPLPELNWTMSRTADGGSITLRSPTKPLTILMFHATTIDGNSRRDFRLLNAPDHDPSNPILHPVFWETASVTEKNNGEYVVERKNPKSGWTAFFIQVTYPAALSGEEMMFTTQVNIIPDTFPYPDCHGEGCRGSLI